jgi:hypothetical protein
MFNPIKEAWHATLDVIRVKMEQAYCNTKETSKDPKHRKYSGAIV